MKTLIITIFSFLSVNSFSQNYWIPTGTITPGNSDWVYSMTSNQQGELFASSWAVGVYKSTDQVHWNISGLNGKRVSYLTVAPNGDIYGLSITQSFSYIHRSTDDGVTWTDVYTGSFPINYAGGGAIVFPSDGSIVAAFAVTVGPLIGNVSTFVFKSTNGGDNWFQTQVIDLGFVGGMVITADNKILIGTSLGGVLYSANNGNSFSHLNSFPSIFIKTILKAPDNTIYVSDAFGLNRSTDNGDTFENAGGQNSTAYLRAADVSSNGDVFISTDDRRVFRSSDRGDSWNQITNGFPGNAQVYSFTCSNGKMFSGTNNSGAFYFVPLTGISSSNERVNNFRLYQNYPNPFNPETIINYELESAQYVTLKIYDIIGNEVADIVNKDQPAGNHSYKWDASNFPGGTYFYRLNIAGNTQTKSMVLIK